MKAFIFLPFVFMTMFSGKKCYIRRLSFNSQRIRNVEWLSNTLSENVKVTNIHQTEKRKRVIPDSINVDQRHKSKDKVRQHRIMVLCSWREAEAGEWEKWYITLERKWNLKGLWEFVNSLKLTFPKKYSFVWWSRAMSSQRNGF